MAKNEFFVNSAESSRLIYDFVLKSMKEAGVGMPFFPGGLFMQRGSPNRNFTAFMAGRYGADALGRFLSVCGCICILVSVAVRGKSAFFSAVFSAAALALLIWCYVRIFSRKVAARSEENRKYLSYRNRFFGSFRLLKSCFRQRKEYAFFRCPSCREVVRVPRGKGKIRITCPRCGYAFEKKT